MKLKLKHHFDAAHRLENYDGACSNLHGHRWNILVEIEDEVDSKTGMIIDFKEIKKIIDLFDHTTILKDCDENFELIAVLKKFGRVLVRDYTPTAENIALDIQADFAKSGRKVKITLWESPEASIIV